jgi:type IX secretion system PorP/SprF family membrane protein
MFLSHRYNAASHNFDLVNDYSEYNYFLNGGYLVQLSAKWKLLPSVLVRFQPASLPQADVNSCVIYNDRIWMGISYRSNQSIIGLFIYQVNNQLALAYSYDLGFGRIGNILGGSHEIMIRYDFRYIIDIVNPRFF